MNIDISESIKDNYDNDVETKIIDEQGHNLLKLKKKEIIVKDAKQKREKFLPHEQKAIIEVYDKYTDKAFAMKVVRNMPGLENMYERKIKRWKSSNKTMGKPISHEFEDEVYEEYKQLIKDCGDVSFTMVNTIILKQCGINIFHRDYLDITSNKFIKKWHYDPHTAALQFTNKWVSGFIRRRRLKLYSHETPQVQVLNTTLSSSTDHTINENFYVLHVNSVDSIRGSFHITDGDDVNDIRPNRRFHHHHHHHQQQQQPSLISSLIRPTSQYPTLSQPSSNQVEAIIDNLYHAEIINDDNIFVPAFDDFDLSFITFD